MSKYQQHQNQLNKTTLYLQKKFPAFRFFNRHVGKFYNQRIFHQIKNIKTISDLKSFLFSIKNKHIISINKPGMPDQYVIAPIEINGKLIPIHMEIETKTGSGKLSDDQKKWKRIYEKMGVKYIVSRNELEVEKEINEYINQLQS